MVTKNLIHNIKDVPITWIFEFFCSLKENLTGKTIKIKSLFNPKERTPSLVIYLDATNIYRFKDFSTGRGGSAVDLVKELYNISFHNACNLIVEKYNDYILNNKHYLLKDLKKESNYRVTNYKIRSWTVQDQYYWTKFNIGSKLLNMYNVKPLESYNMTKDDSEICIKGLYIYGYFKKDGTLYKIYQPKTIDKKFIKVDNYIQGWDQLLGHDYLLITSSLKDIMSIKSFNLKVDLLAPDSENTMFKSDVINTLKKKFKKIIILFDNDEAGIKAMIKYKEKYPFIITTVLCMSKDVSDSIKDFGAKKVFFNLVPLLNKKINEN